MVLRGIALALVQKGVRGEALCNEATRTLQVTISYQVLMAAGIDWWHNIWYWYSSRAYQCRRRGWLTDWLADGHTAERVMQLESVCSSTSAISAWPPPPIIRDVYWYTDNAFSVVKLHRLSAATILRYSICEQNKNKKIDLYDIV